MKKLLKLIGGILFIAFGIYTFLQEGDFVTVRGAPVSKVFHTAFFVFLGLWFIYDDLFRKKKSESEYFAVCIECKKIFIKSQTKDKSCPKCGGQLEEIKGIFDRQPEFFDKKRET